MHAKSLGSKIFDVVNIVFMLSFIATVLFPFIYMFSVSISDPTEVGLMRVVLWPKGVQWKSYISVFKDAQILTAYWNSILYTALGTFLALIFNGLASYSLSRPEFAAKKFFAVMFLITMYFNGGMIPSYLNVKNLGLLDTMWAIVLPSAVGMWNIVLMRTSFAQLPSSLIESAYIDGANDWYIFFKIVMPLSKAIFATIAVFVSVSIWNNYFGPLLYLTSPSKEPLTIILRRILVSNEALKSAVDTATSVGGSSSSTIDPATYQGMLTSLKMATIFVTVGPIVFIYPFAQKYFVKGVLIGSIKG